MLSQTAYIEEVLERFDLSNTTPRRTPMDENGQLWVQPKDTPVDEPLRKRYRQMVGCLNYLVSTTRFDIAFAVGVLGRFQSNPSEAHWQAAVRVCQYLVCTKRFELTIGGQHESPLVELYTDADHAADKDSRRSVYGVLINVFGSPVYWTSKQIKSVTDSSWQSEYIALAKGTSRLLSVLALLRDLGYKPGKPPVFCDNQSAIASIKSGHLHHEKRHVDVSPHVMRSTMATSTCSGLERPGCAPTFSPKPLEGLSWKG